MRLALVVVLSACAAPQRTSCPESKWSLVKTIETCGSGSLFEVIDGRGQGKIVYATGAAAKTWNIGYATFAPGSPGSGSNQCRDRASGGELIDLDGFDTESEAREAFLMKHCAK
jgi:hypothetical protein